MAMNEDDPMEFDLADEYDLWLLLSPSDQEFYVKRARALGVPVGHLMAQALNDYRARHPLRQRRAGRKARRRAE
jgi:hypothetical protein